MDKLSHRITDGLGYTFVRAQHVQKTQYVWAVVRIGSLHTFGVKFDIKSKVECYSSAIVAGLPKPSGRPKEPIFISSSLGHYWVL